MRLSRELRFSLKAAEVPADGINNFAGHPALEGLAPFLTLGAVVEGQPDPATGMLMNIKLMDQLLRDHLVPMINTYWRNMSLPGRPWGGADLFSPMVGLLVEKLYPRRLDTLRLELSPFLSYLCLPTELPMVRLSERFEFSAAHRLHSPQMGAQANREVFGKCNNPSGHGHNYEVEVVIAGEPDPHTGLIMPVGELQRIVNQRVITIFDHKHLNVDCQEFRTLNPTVENIAQVIYDKLADGFCGAVRLAAVKVWDTPKTWSEVTSPVK